MRLNNDGITRHVILTKSYAIKIPRLNYGWFKFIQGIYSNLSEWDVWRYTKSQQLCPVLYSFGGFFNVMPRVRILTDSDNHLIPVDDEETGGDDKPDNYGWYRDRIVKVDYPYAKIDPNNRQKTLK